MCGNWEESPGKLGMTAVDLSEAFEGLLWGEVTEYKGNTLIHGPLPKHHRDRVTEEGTTATRFWIWKTDGRRMMASSGCRKATASTLREESLVTG